MTRAVASDKLAECKKCHSHTVTWQKSRRTGNFYLTEVFRDVDGDLITDRTDFHSTYCGDEDKHVAKQNSISVDDGGEEIGKQIEEERRAMELTMNASAATAATYFLKLHDLCKNRPDEATAHLKALILEQGAGDDSAQLAGEIAFCYAALGLVAVE